MKEGKENKSKDICNENEAMIKRKETEMEKE